MIYGNKRIIDAGTRLVVMAIVAVIGAATLPGARATGQQQAKPNILFIMGDDIGWMQVGVYHRWHRAW